MYLEKNTTRKDINIAYGNVKSILSALEIPFEERRYTEVMAAWTTELSGFWVAGIKKISATEFWVIYTPKTIVTAELFTDIKHAAYCGCAGCQVRMEARRNQ